MTSDEQAEYRASHFTDDTTPLALAVVLVAAVLVLVGIGVAAWWLGVATR